jgi:hypothetical protein
MKKILIPALLVVSAAFAPGLRDAFEFPERACRVAQEIASPLFWHLWDMLLTRELARGRQAASAGDEPEWQPALGKEGVVCIFLHVFLKHAFDGALSVAKKNDTFLVSIPGSLIRRTVERGLNSFPNTRQLNAESKFARRWS